MQLAREIWEQWQIPLALLLVYWLIAAAIVRFVHRRWCRKRCAANPQRYRWMFALVLALLFTPSVVSDFFLFMIPGPALLGFLLLVPTMVLQLFSEPRFVSAVFVTTAVYHLLPLSLGFAIAYWLLGRELHHSLPDAERTV